MVQITCLYSFVQLEEAIPYIYRYSIVLYRFVYILVASLGKFKCNHVDSTWAVIGGVPEGNRRDHNIVRVSSFASKELSWHERSGIVLVVLDIRKTQACPSKESTTLPLYAFWRYGPRRGPYHGPPHYGLYSLWSVSCSSSLRAVSYSSSPRAVSCRSVPACQSVPVCRSEPVGRSQPLAGKSECHMIPSVTC